VSFDNLGLSAEILRAVADEGYEVPTPVQEQAIPIVLAGRDLLAAAQTGTGKTAAFVLPILQLLSPTANTSFSPARHPVRALILTPTRELAMQIAESVKAYGRHVPLRSALVYGGVPVDPQAKETRAGVEILVATPGRLLDLVGQKAVSLGQVGIFVLDEADRMLDMGFIPDIRRIMDLLPAKRQNLLFSATFNDDVRRLSGSILSDPKTVEVARRNTAVETVRQLLIPVDRDRKTDLLAHLIRTRGWHQVLVFTRTKIAASRLARDLDRAGIAAIPIHSDRTQSERTRALADFKSGEVEVLVATDVASRGLDIEELPVVVNYELPLLAEDYLHRIGRTARAGLDGDAVSLACIDEVDLLRAIQRLLKGAIPWEVEPGFVPDRNVEPRPISGRFSTGAAVRDAHETRAREGAPRRGGVRPRPAGVAGRRSYGR
jgi:ATP-dependent RNA helicase RhlE